MFLTINGDVFPISDEEAYRLFKSISEVGYGFSFSGTYPTTFVCSCGDDIFFALDGKTQTISATEARKLLLEELKHGNHICKS